jgi:hypothetical protein
VEIHLPLFDTFGWWMSWVNVSGWGMVSDRRKKALCVVEHGGS